MPCSLLLAVAEQLTERMVVLREELRYRTRRSRCGGTPYGRRGSSGRGFRANGGSCTRLRLGRGRSAWKTFRCCATLTRCGSRTGHQGANPTGGGCRSTSRSSGHRSQRGTNSRQGTRGNRGGGSRSWRNNREGGWQGANSCQLGGSCGVSGGRLASFSLDTHALGGGGGPRRGRPSRVGGSGGCRCSSGACTTGWGTPSSSWGGG